MLIKGGSDVTIRSCRVLKNKVGVQVGFNYGGNVVVEESIFSGNLLKDLLEETLETDTDTKKLKGFLPQTMLEKVKAERMLHEKAGAWSSATPITKIRNRFLSRSERIPEIEELKSASMAAPQQPLPQKLAWEAAARGRYSLATPCPCGFSCTELGNSAECGQAGLGNHVDYPPLMCLPCSESLEAKQDDANGQFYFLDGRVPFRHWCLVGEIKAVDVARGADAHSFMAARGSDAAKTIKLQTKFAGPGEVDVEVLLMLEDALPRGSAAIESGNTLAILYAEAHDIDITRGTGQVVVADNSSIYAFAASLDQVVGQSAQFASSDGNARCGHCGEDASASSQRCRSCGKDLHTKPFPQTAMLQQLATADFRSFTSRYSFKDWAAGLPEWFSGLEVAEVAGEGGPDANEPQMTAQPSRSADEWCELLDVAVNGELTNVIAAIEEALQEKRSDGSFVLNKSNGRNKLQNKLKRAKGRNITKVEESKESSPELDHLARQETSEAKVEDEVLEDHVENIAGLGEMDLDGYHGVHRLPKIPLLPWKVLDRCKHRSHVFVSGPELPTAWPYPWPRPDNVPWCTSMKPMAFCGDFKEISRHEKYRILSCWGHHQTRPGHEIPRITGSSERLWKIRPNDIACSQDSIGKKFKDGQSLEETLSQLRSGQCKVDDIERIQISWHSHDPKSPGQPRWWTYTGNRRLSLFQRLEDEGCLEFIVAQWVNTPVPEWRMTTKKPGVRAYVRK